MCGKPTRNDEPGYSWDGKSRSVHGVNLPTLLPDDKLLFDEPGRCGGLDSHCHEYRLVLEPIYGPTLLYRHGGGEGRIHLSGPVQAALTALDSNGRYWIMNALFHAQDHATEEATNREGMRWRRAAAEKRIRVRKARGRDLVRVWIESATDKAFRELAEEGAAKMRESA